MRAEKSEAEGPKSGAMVRLLRRWATKPRKKAATKQAVVRHLKAESANDEDLRAAGYEPLKLDTYHERIEARGTTISPNEDVNFKALRGGHKKPTKVRRINRRFKRNRVAA